MTTPVMPCPEQTDAASAMPAGAVVLRDDASSASVCFLTLFGLSAWQIGKSFKRINLAYVPEWYHTGGPTQIGPATPLDPSFAVLAADTVKETCVQESDDERFQTHVCRLRHQFFAYVGCLRGPPVLV